MKRHSKIVYITIYTLVIIMTFSTLCYAETGIKEEKIDINNLESGWKIEPVSDFEIAEAIMKNTGCSFEKAVKEIARNEKARTVVQGYRVYKDYIVKIDQAGVSKGTFRHSIMVDASGEGTLKWIDKVYSSSIAVTPLSSMYTWEPGSSALLSWNRTSLSMRSYGNAVYQTTSSISFPLVPGVIESSIGGNYYYRSEKDFNTQIVMG